jgi:hypothetical protein
MKPRHFFRDVEEYEKECVTLQGITAWCHQEAVAWLGRGRLDIAVEFQKSAYSSHIQMWARMAVVLGAHEMEPVSPEVYR